MSSFLPSPSLPSLPFSVRLFPHGAKVAAICSGLLFHPLSRLCGKKFLFLTVSEKSQTEVLLVPMGHWFWCLPSTVTEAGSIHIWLARPGLHDHFWDQGEAQDNQGRYSWTGRKEFGLRAPTPQYSWRIVIRAAMILSWNGKRTGLTYSYQEEGWLCV